MFDEKSPAPALPKSRAEGRNVPSPGNLKMLTHLELLKLRDEINGLLPEIEVKDIDMGREIVYQLTALRQLQSESLTDSEVPANQKAQVANSMTSVLDKLVSLQDRVFNQERIKRMEQALIYCLSQVDQEVSERFLRIYTKAVEELK